MKDPTKVRPESKPVEQELKLDADDAGVDDAGVDDAGVAEPKPRWTSNGYYLVDGDNVIQEGIFEDFRSGSCETKYDSMISLEGVPMTPAEAKCVFVDNLKLGRSEYVLDAASGTIGTWCMTKKNPTTMKLFLEDARYTGYASCFQSPLDESFNQTRLATLKTYFKDNSREEYKPYEEPTWLENFWKHGMPVGLAFVLAGVIVTGIGLVVGTAYRIKTGRSMLHDILSKVLNGGKDSKDAKELKDSKESKDSKDAKELKDSKELKEPKDIGDAKEPRRLVEVVEDYSPREERVSFGERASSPTGSINAVGAGFVVGGRATPAGESVIGARSTAVRDGAPTLRDATKNAEKARVRILGNIEKAEKR